MEIYTILKFILAVLASGWALVFLLSWVLTIAYKVSCGESWYKNESWIYLVIAFIPAAALKYFY